VVSHVGGPGADVVYGDSCASCGLYIHSVHSSAVTKDPDASFELVDMRGCELVDAADNHDVRIA